MSSVIPDKIPLSWAHCRQQTLHPLPLCFILWSLLGWAVVPLSLSTIAGFAYLRLVERYSHTLHRQPRLYDDSIVLDSSINDYGNTTSFEYFR